MAKTRQGGNRFSSEGTPRELEGGELRGIDGVKLRQLRLLIRFANASSRSSEFGNKAEKARAVTKKLESLPKCDLRDKSNLVRPLGFEPRTNRLRGERSTN